MAVASSKTSLLRAARPRCESLGVYRPRVTGVVVMRRLRRWGWALYVLVAGVAWGQASVPDEGLRIMANRSQGNCMACHEIPALREALSPAQRLTLQGTLGPSLQGVGARYNRQQLRQWLVDARVLRPDTMMPPYGTTQGLQRAARSQSLLSSEQIDAVVDTLMRFTQSSSLPAQSAAQPTGAVDSTVARVQAMDGMSPVDVWIDQGRVVWRRDCESCHQLSAVVKHVARFPRGHAQRQLINLEDQILLCRQRTVQRSEPPVKASIEDAVTLGLSAFLHQQARQQTLELEPPASAVEAAQWRQHLAQGEALYNTRIGNLNLSCRQCHDDHVGVTLRSFRVTPAYPVGFPVYRLSWQGMGSMDRRLRACFSGVQAEMPPAQDLQLRQIELYLKHRARGQALEGPSVKP